VDKDTAIKMVKSGDPEQAAAGVAYLVEWMTVRDREHAARKATTVSFGNGTPPGGWTEADRVS
jgi:hypothetical protein